MNLNKRQETRMSKIEHSLLSEPLIFDIQRFAEGDEIEYFEFIDPQNNKKILIPKTVGDEDDQVNMQELIGHIIGKSRADAKKEIDKQNSPLMDQLEKERSKNSELDAKLQQIEDEIAAEV